MVDVINPIKEALDVAPSLCSTDTKILLVDRYETAYGICNHDAASATRPLILVAMHSSEDSSNGSVLYERIEQFADYQVSKFFGMSFNEFLELPKDVCDKILEISAKRQKIEGTAAANVLSELERNR